MVLLTTYPLPLTTGLNYGHTSLPHHHSGNSRPALPVRAEKCRRYQEIARSSGATLNLLLCIYLFNNELSFSAPWAGYGFDFSLRLYHFSGFIMLAAAGFTFLIALYSTVFMSGKNYANQFFSYMLISTAMVNGAVLADNLIVMLFFWKACWRLCSD